MLNNFISRPAHTITRKNVALIKFLPCSTCTSDRRPEKWRRVLFLVRFQTNSCLEPWGSGGKSSRAPPVRAERDAWPLRTRRRYARICHRDDARPVALQLTWICYTNKWSFVCFRSALNFFLDSANCTKTSFFNKSIREYYWSVVKVTMDIYYNICNYTSVHQ